MVSESWINKLKEQGRWDKLAEYGCYPDGNVPDVPSLSTEQRAKLNNSKDYVKGLSHQSKSNQERNANRIMFRLPHPLIDQLRGKCAKEGIKVSTFLHNLVREALKDG